MGSAKQQSSISRIMSLLKTWDGGSKVVRKRILDDFIGQNQNKTGPELDAEFAQAASLFLTRLTAWLRLTYPLIIYRVEIRKVDMRHSCVCVFVSTIIVRAQVRAYVRA